jgi:hypothetical protein
MLGSHHIRQPSRIQTDSLLSSRHREDLIRSKRSTTEHEREAQMRTYYILFILITFEIIQKGDGRKEGTNVQKQQ